MMNLSEIIIQKIRKQGPISFQDFMEMCLYYPGLGYYSSPAEKIGSNGDFYTSPSLTPIFGAMIGRQLEEMWQVLGEKPFTIVEYGAGTGALCHDILFYLQNNRKMYDQLKYCIIEKSLEMRKLEKQHLSEKVYWYDSITEISSIHGCVLSNELLDNFPVHQVVMQKELMEVSVDYQDAFVEKLHPARDEIREYLLELNIELPEGFRTEVNLQALDWISDVATALHEGYVLTIDYGYRSEELYKRYRSQGTLVCYYKHAVNDLLYENIGRQDITSHVNFSALEHWGAKSGLTNCGFTDQCHFLLPLGIKEYITRCMSREADVVKAAKKASFLSHTLLMDMGSKFKVLIQKKGSCERTLSGLKWVLPTANLKK